MEQPTATGILYKDMFWDGHSKFMDGQHTQITNACSGSGGAVECQLPAPTEY